MSVKVRKIRGKYRVVESDTARISKTKNGVAKDGGGHIRSKKAHSQARHIHEGIAKNDTSD